ncbi:MAG: NAD-dependent epimerase/dehydratase family protein [Acidimicrobiales bacterium]
MSIHLDHYARKRVVVTGGAGAIGRNLTATLAALGAESVIVLDDLSSAEPWNLPEERNVLFVEGSVTDDAALKRVFSEKPHIVFHLAAFFANQRSVDYPERDLEVNGMGTLRLLQMASLCGIDRFVYASSGCSVYGDAAPLPLVEEFMSLHLTSPYQITKVLGEYYANFYRHHHELPIAIARLFNSYGPGEIPGQYRNVIPNFVYWAMQGRPLPLTGNPHATRDFTFVGDIVDGLLRIGFDQNAIGEAMNIASGRETRISDLADMVNELTGNEAGVVKAAPRRWDTKDRLLASTELARDLVGYQPQTDFASGLRQTYDWFTTNWNDIAQAADFPPGMSSAVRELEA